MAPRARIVVVGSINMDLVVRCRSLPVPGQTTLAEECLEMPGGKGANQAVAASRAGGEVAMIGRVGDDAFAERLLDSLRDENVCIDRVVRTGGVSSGLAIVAVESSGENSIVVVPGANARVTPDDIRASTDTIAGAEVLLIQLEIPIPTVLAAMSIARDAGVRIILDPAPMPNDFDEALMNVDVTCPNQVEAAAIVNRTIDTIDDANQGVGELRQRGVRCAIITMGEQGSVVHDGSGVQWIEPLRVQPVDATAAGDAFAGALAVRLAEGTALAPAARFASVAGGLAATRVGAQRAMAKRTDIESALATIGH